MLSTSPINLKRRKKAVVVLNQKSNLPKTSNKVFNNLE